MNDGGNKIWNKEGIHFITLAVVVNNANSGGQAPSLQFVLSYKLRIAPFQFNKHYGKRGLLSLLVIMMLFSCSKNFYGTYNTNYSKDKSAFFQIKLNADSTVEKTEVHTISDFATGRFLLINKQIVCFFDSSRNKFPPDTVTFMKRGKKLYFVKNGMGNGRTFLLKQ